MNLEKVIFGFFIVLAATLNFGFFVGDIENPAHHDVYELFAALVVSLIATVLKFGDRTQIGAVHLSTSLVADLQLFAAALVWGYEADHPFADQCAKFAAAGIPFFVCPGTSAWNSIAGRTRNALDNIRSAATEGLRHGATGFLVTDWGDNGHWQPLPASYAGFLASAACAWNPDGYEESNLGAALDHMVYPGMPGLGAWSLALGDVHRVTQVTIHNTSALFRIVKENDLQPWTTKITPEALQQTRAALEQLATSLDHIPPADPVIIAEWRLALLLLQHGCKRLEAFSGISSGKSGLFPALAVEMEQLIQTYKTRWLQRNRPGGLADSVQTFENRLSEYRSLL